MKLLLVFLVVKVDVGRIHTDDGFVEQAIRLLHVFGLDLRRRSLGLAF